MNKKLIEKIYDLGVSIRQAESLNKALVECMDNDYHLKPIDCEHMSEILLLLMNNLRSNFNKIDKMIVDLSIEEK